MTSASPFRNLLRGNPVQYLIIGIGDPGCPTYQGTKVFFWKMTYRAGSKRRWDLQPFQPVPVDPAEKAMGTDGGLPVKP